MYRRRYSRGDGSGSAGSAGSDSRLDGRGNDDD